MDEELEASGVRQTSITENSGEEDGIFSMKNSIIDDTVKIDPQVLSSLLKSLEAETGIEIDPTLSKMLGAMDQQL
jgi:hypothetical protein